MTGTGRPEDGHVGDLVSAHLDGELDAETSAGVRAHLDECEPCRALAVDADLARAWVRGLPAVDATPIVEHLLARHRAAIRAGAAFVGMAAVVVGSLALTAAVIRPNVVPDVDALVAAHLAATGSSDRSSAGPVMDALDGMAGAELVRRVSTPYSAPPVMSGHPSSLSRRAVYDGDDLTVVVYDDGSITVTVFQQPGRLDWDALPRGTAATAGNRTVWMPAGTSRRREPTVLVSQIGHIVVTVISEDRDAAIAVVDGLPDSHRDSALDRVHDACSRFTEVFALAS